MAARVCRSTFDPAANGAAAVAREMDMTSTPFCAGFKRAQPSQATFAGDAETVAKQARIQNPDPAASGPWYGHAFASQRSTDIATAAVLRVNAASDVERSATSPAPARLLRFPSTAGGAWPSAAGTADHCISAQRYAVPALNRECKDSHDSGTALLVSTLPQPQNTAGGLSHQPGMLEASHTVLAALPFVGVDCATTDHHLASEQADNDYTRRLACPDLGASQRSNGSSGAGGCTQSSSGGPALAMTPPKLRRPSVASALSARQPFSQVQLSGSERVLDTPPAPDSLLEDGAECTDNDEDENLRVISMPAFQGAAQELCSPDKRPSPAAIQVRACPVLLAVLRAL